MSKIYGDIDKVGKEAIAKGLKEPKAIFWALHPGTKINKELLKKHRDELANEKASGKKKEAKK